MAYLTEESLKQMNFRHLGKNVKISDKASIYNSELMEIGDNSRIDDFCVISGKVILGQYCHITPMCLVAGGVPGVHFSDFTTLAYGVKVFAQSDDYSGLTMTNSLVPKKYKNELYKSVNVGRYVIVGAGTTILPGAHIAEGCAIGAMSLVTKSTEPWGIYFGVPVQRIKEREKKMLELEKEFLLEVVNDSV